MQLRAKVWVHLGSLYINTGESLDVPVHTLKEKYPKWSLTARNLCQIVCNVLCSSLAHLHSWMLSQVRVCPLAHFIGWLTATRYTFFNERLFTPMYVYTHTQTNFQQILGWLVTGLMALLPKGMWWIIYAHNSKHRSFCAAEDFTSVFAYLLHGRLPGIILNCLDEGRVKQKNSVGHWSKCSLLEWNLCLCLDVVKWSKCDLSWWCGRI